MKKIVIVSAVILAAVFLTVYFVPLKGPWIDGAVSAYLSLKFRSPLRVKEAKIERLSVIFFRSLALTDRAGRDWATTGPGRVSRASSRLYIRLTGAALSPQTAGRLAMLSSVLPDGGKGFFEAEEISAVVVDRQMSMTVHVSRWVSGAFTLKGGIKFSGGKAVKAHALLLFSPAFVEKLPGEVRSRLKPRPDGSGEFRLAFLENKLTLAGATGPVLKAQWQRAA